MSDWPWSLVFEVAFDVDAMSEPGPGDWTDLSSRLEGRAHSVRGMGRSGNSSGEASVTLNNRDRALDPTNVSATYNLVPMRHARLQAVYDATTYDLFTGWVDGWSPAWPQWGQSLTQVRLVDAMAMLGTIDVDVDLPRQRTGERIDALLDLASWPASLRDIDTGVVTLEPLELDRSNVRQEIDDAADAEDGYLWIAGDGGITFRSRHSRLGVSSQATFGVGGMKVSSVDPVYDTQLLTNVAIVTSEAGEEFTATRQAAVDAYGYRDVPVRDLGLPGYESQALAEWILYRLADPRLWLDGVAVESRNGGAAMFGLTIADLVTFAHTPPGDAGDVDADLHVERIRHEVSRDGSWIARFDLSPYFGAGGWMTWNDDLGSQGGPGWDDEGAQWAP